MSFPSLFRSLSIAALWCFPDKFALFWPLQLNSTRHRNIERSRLHRTLENWREKIRRRRWRKRPWDAATASPTCRAESHNEVHLHGRNNELHSNIGVEKHNKTFWTTLPGHNLLQNVSYVCAQTDQMHVDDKSGSWRGENFNNSHL